MNVEIHPFMTLNRPFRKGNRVFRSKYHAQGKSYFSSWIGMAHHPSLSAAEISAQICKRSASLETLVIPGKKTLWVVRVELHRHIKSHSFAGGRSRQSGNIFINATDRWSRCAGIQSAQEPEGRVLGRSLSRDCCTNGWASDSLPELYRSEHGARRRGLPS